MLLKVIYYKNGKDWVGFTRCDGKVHSWYHEDLGIMRKKAGSFLATSHKKGELDYVSKFLFVEGSAEDVSNYDIVWLVSEPEKKRRRRRHLSNLFDQDHTNEPKKDPIIAKGDEDTTSYIYKEEDGILKIYSKKLCAEYRISAGI